MLQYRMSRPLLPCKYISFDSSACLHASATLRTSACAKFILHARAFASVPLYQPTPGVQRRGSAVGAGEGGRGQHRDDFPGLVGDAYKVDSLQCPGSTERSVSGVPGGGAALIHRAACVARREGGVPRTVDLDALKAWRGAHCMAVGTELPTCAHAAASGKGGRSLKATGACCGRARALRLACSVEPLSCTFCRKC